jgi:hypothetical protein
MRRAPPPQGNVLLSDRQLDLVSDASHRLPPQKGGVLWSRVMRHLNFVAGMDGPSVTDSEVEAAIDDAFGSLLRESNIERRRKTTARTHAAR